MKYLFLSLILVTNLSISAEGTKQSSKKSSPANKMSELGKIDGKTLELEPTSKKDEIADDTALVMKPDEVKVSFSCKAVDGHEVKQGEAGYDDCLQKMKNDKHNPHAPNADLKVNFKK